MVHEKVPCGKNQLSLTVSASALSLSLSQTFLIFNYSYASTFFLIVGSSEEIMLLRNLNFIKIDRPSLGTKLKQNAVQGITVS